MPTLRLSPQQRQKALRLARRPRLLPLLRYGVFPSLEHVRVPFGRADTVLDVGASRGQFATLVRHMRPHARIICFEPLPAAVATLRRVGARYNLDVHATALDDREGSAPLFVATSDDSSSLLPLTERLRAESDLSTSGTAQVPTSRLDDLELDIHRPCLLKIDAQGSELRILRGARATLERVDEAYIECSFVELYEGQPLAAEIVAFMAEAGFGLAGIYNIALSRDGAQQQADFHFRRGQAVAPSAQSAHQPPAYTESRNAPARHNSSDAATEYMDYGWATAEADVAAPYVNRAIDRLINPRDGSRVLDVGCGNGFLAGLLADRGCEVVGIDPSESGIELARRHYPGVRFEVVAADDAVLERLGEAPFDYVVSTEVIEHLYAPDALVQGMYGALKDGGTAVFSTPYHGYLKNLALALAGAFDTHWHPAKRGGHIKFWSRNTLIELLHEAGFEDCEFRGGGRVPFLWKSMLIAARRPATTSHAQKR